MLHRYAFEAQRRALLSGATVRPASDSFSDPVLISRYPAAPSALGSVIFQNDFEGWLTGIAPQYGRAGSECIKARALLSLAIQRHRFAPLNCAVSVMVSRSSFVK